MILGVAMLETQTAAQLRAEPLAHGSDALGGKQGEILGGNDLLHVEAGEDKLEQFLANRSHGALRRKVRDIEMIDAADLAIRGQQGFNDFVIAVFHGRKG